MRLAAVMIMAALVGGRIWAGEPASIAANRTVRVCMDSGSDIRTLDLAQELASGIFADAGVRIEWLHPPHSPRSCSTGRKVDADIIVVSLSYYTPKDQLPGAWAYARPYEGSHIVVFYDRVREKMPSGVSILLGHELAHEITHILQGASRHSASGLMKPQWGAADLAEMGRKPLGFAEEDVLLINQGLDARNRIPPAQTLSANRDK